LTRSSLSHVLSIVIPSVGITYISFFAAMLTPKSGERVGLDYHVPPCSRGRQLHFE
jgi:hypothetical protein